MSSVNAAKVFLELVNELNPPLRLAVGADRTEGIVRESNLVLRQFMGLCESGTDASLVKNVAQCFFQRDTWAVNHPGGLSSIFELCLGTAKNPRHLENAVLNVGFGGSDEGVPLRALAYALPWLETARRINKLGLSMPTIRLFTGQMMAAHCLGKDKKLLWTNTATLFALIRGFAQRFYVEVAPQLLFDFDRPVEGDLKATLEILARVFKQRANSDEITREALEILEAMASSHGGELFGSPTDSALLYGAAHPTVFGDFDFDGQAQTPYLEKIRGVRKMMIGLGTRAETKFWRVRRALAAQASRVLRKVEPRPWIMFFTDIGWDKPPYYRHPKGDLNWTAAVTNWQQDWGRLPKTVQSELQMIAEAAGGINPLLEWVDSVRRLFGEVENTGPHAEELLAHALLGSPIILECVKKSGLSPKNDIDLTTWVGTLNATDEQEIIQRVRREWMGI